MFLVSLLMYILTALGLGDRFLGGGDRERDREPFLLEYLPTGDLLLLLELDEPLLLLREDRERESRVGVRERERERD